MAHVFPGREAEALTLHSSSEHIAFCWLVSIPTGAPVFRILPVALLPIPQKEYTE